MTREEKLEQIVEKIRKVRDLQRKYFRTRHPHVLDASRQAERELDQMIKRLDEEDAAARQPRLL